MPTKSNNKIKYCVYCGEDVGTSETYCLSCGKLVVKLKNGKIQTKKPIIHKATPDIKAEISRKCPGCGSIITSTILDQCPVCNTTLEKVSEAKKALIQKKPGLIFTNKKLEPEQKFIIKRETWNLREGINVVGTCTYIFIIAFFLIYFLLTFQGSGGSVEPTIQNFIITQIPEVLFGIYPLYYIYSKKHSYKKLGFLKDSKKILTGIFIGLLGAISLILLDLLYSSLLSSLAEIGLNFFDVAPEIALQNQIIRDAEFLWAFLFISLMALANISFELVFRGVLHNTLKQKFQNIIIVIPLVALVYSLLMLFLFPNPALFLLNFLVFVVLGILYEVSSGNIYSTT
ncbi:MAG: CPBP family intramembrane glutamic endopeptidase [Promethearchaeota archaeon]|jgi:membrane protease YdiL (CAAX protease family)